MADVTGRLANLSPTQRQLLLERLRQEKEPDRAPHRPPLVRRPETERAGSAPLSFAQQRLWFLTRMEPGSPAYNVPAAVRLSGPLDLDALHRALEGVTARHEALRTRFEVAGGEVRQCIAPVAEVPLSLVDLASTAADEAALRAAVDAALRRPFDLVRGPLLRALVVRRGPEEHLLVLTMHHISSDGWSMGVLMREMSTLYEATVAERPGPLPELPVQYADFAEWQRAWLQGEALERLLAGWRRRLVGAPPPAAFPADRPRSASGGSAGAQVPVRLEGVTAALTRFAQGENASPFMVLLAAFAALLRRYSGEDDVVVGTPIAGRNHPEVEGLIGFFVNSLALRVDVSGTPSLRQLTRRTRDVALASYAEQDLPFEKLVEELRRERGGADAPLFRMVLQVRNEPRETLRVPGLALEPVEVETRTAKFDMVVNLNDDGGLGGVWKYSTALYDRTTALRIARHFERLVARALETPDRPLSELSPLSARERRTLLTEWNGAAPQTLRNATLVSAFEAQAALRPDAVAVAGGTEALTYRCLDRLSRTLAGRLAAVGIGRGDRVGVLLERSPRSLAVLLGVARTGAAYVPLDPRHPRERLRFVLLDTGARALVTDQEPGPELAGIPNLAVLAADAGGAAAGAAPGLPGPVDPEGTDPAYVIYTSGSTGRPKGVPVAHGQVVRLLDATAPWFRFGPDDVWTLFHSVAFDFSVWEIWGALLLGGRLEVLSHWQSRSPLEVHELLLQRRVTVLNQTPSAFRPLIAADAASPAPLDSLRWVVFGGEALDPESLVPWWRRYGDDGPGLVNMYGITETTVHVTFRRLRPADAARGSVIGTPIPDLRTYVADAAPEHGPELAPVGVAGELWIGGAGVAAGYVGRPALTGERFVPDRWSELPGARAYRSGDLGRWRREGELEYLGRIDQQVKIRGFRIEPGEIEAALVAEPEVREAAVLAVRDDAGAARLRAAVVPAPGASLPTLQELRRRLAERLPEHMVPAELVVLDALPLTSTGKLDRRTLASQTHRPHTEPARPERSAPATPLERRLAAVWAEVLGLPAGEEIDTGADFFDLGGDSIRAAVLANRLQEVVGEIVHVVAVFDAPTLSSLARYLEESYPAAAALAGSGGTPVPDRPATGRLDAEALARARELVRRGRPRGPVPPADTDGRKPEAIFVLAPPRSGTTLLRVLLGGHPDLFAPPELELLSFRTLAERSAAFAGRDSFWLEGTIRALMEVRGCGADEARTALEAYERDGWSTLRLYRTLQEELGGRRLVDKTPSYTLDPAVLARAEEEFDGARYLHLVRHPGGMIRSFEEARLDEIFFRYPHDFPRRELAELIWTLGHGHVLEFLGSVPPERRHRVVFEDLVRDPRRVLEGVCAFLGLDLHPDMLDPYREGARRMTDGLHAESRMLGDVKFHTHRRIDPAAADAWRAHLDEGSLGEPTREVARELGYDLPPFPGSDAEPILPPIPVSGDAEAPASFAQERLWFLDQLEPGLPAYNLPLAASLDGRLDPAAFRRALERVVKRHGALRTRFESRPGGPVQVVEAPSRLALPVVDLSDLAGDRRSGEARQLAAAEGRRGFDLSAGPLFRAALLHLGPAEHWALLTLHHAVADGWSLGVLLREAGDLYAALVEGREPALPPLPIQYVDFARWQREALGEEVLQEQLAYWRERLADDEPIELPTDRPRPAAQTFRGGQLGVELPARTWRDLGALARRHAATPFMVLLAGFKALLARYTGQASITVGTPVANRNRVELEGLIGFFVNLVVLRTDLAGDPAFTETIGRVRTTALGAFARQDLPFERLVEELRPRRDPSRNPLFQVAFQTRGPGVPAPAAGEPRIAPVDLETRLSKFDLKLGLGDGSEDLAASLEYNSDLFDPSTAHRILAHLGRLLEGAAERPELRLSELPLLGRAEELQMVVEANDSAVSYPRETPIHVLVAEQARRNPGAPAVDELTETLGYGELVERARRLARHLAAVGVRRGDLVGLCLERSASAVVALLGILEAGAAYLPLDPSDPPERLAWLVEAAQVRAVVTRDALAGRLPSLADPRRLVLLDRDAAEIESRPAHLPHVPCGGSDLAYVIFTSGSTGRPKGVAVPHRAVLRLILGADYARLGAADRVAQVATLSFDAATFEIWGPLLQGGCVVGISRETSLSAADLARELRERGITTLFLTTALFNQVATEVPDAFATLDHLLVGGEAADARRMREVLENGPPRRFLHVYGPTENTTFSSWERLRDLPAEAVTVPIGRPIANSRLYVLDRSGQPVPLGAAGELYTAGEGLAWGYWRRPALTAERFLPDPLSGRAGSRAYRTGDRVRTLQDGAVQFLGRFDHQMKIRGFRVEPGEIEVVLEEHPAVRRAVVLALPRTTASATQPDLRLAAFALPLEGEEPGDLRAYLQGRLPSYMVPSGVVVLGSLPLTPNGKVDRRALVELEGQAAGGSPQEHVPPRTGPEETLAAIWRELLGRERIGAHDDFFDLGGHSLLATRLVSRLRELASQEVPLRLVFEHPTLAGMAAALAESGRPTEPPGGAATLTAEPAAGTDGVDLGALFDELAALSDEEAADLVAQEDLP